MNATELRQSILRAFASVPRPERENIATHICLECDELASDFSKFEATDIPEEIFQKHLWDMPLLSAEAKHFYLPAWLLRGIEMRGPGLSDSCDAVLFDLENAEHRWDPNPPYSTEQWLVIKKWITYLKQFSDEVDLEYIEKALWRVENEL